ncbi:MAG: hypothetical protein BJ554DRAFT_7387, partial [Olpidium bornovanus]
RRKGGGGRRFREGKKKKKLKKGFGIRSNRPAVYPPSDLSYASPPLSSPTGRGPFLRLPPPPPRRPPARSPVPAKRGLPVLQKGNTALHLAVFLDSKEVAQMLLARGADKTVKNGKGFTPVDVSDDAEVSKILTEASPGSPSPET